MNTFFLILSIYLICMKTEENLKKCCRFKFRRFTNVGTNTWDYGIYRIVDPRRLSREAHLLLAHQQSFSYVGTGLPWLNQY